MLKINTQQALKLILFFTLLSSSIYIAFNPTGFLKIFISVIMNISVFLLIIFFFKKIKKTIHIGIYFKFMITLLIFWSLWIILEDISLNPKKLLTLFGNYLMGWAWITPLAFIFGLNIYNWVYLFSFFYKLLFIGCILSTFSFFYLDKISFGLLEWFAFLPILLLTYHYQNNKIKKIIIYSILIYLILTYFASQRANIVFLFLLLIFFIFNFFREKKIKIYKKVILIFSIIISSMILTIQFEPIYTSLSTNKDITADSRSLLVIEMFSDMSPTEQIIGRGALGQYYSPYFKKLKDAGITGGDAAIRSVNEIGYLQMVLKGGFIMMSLYLLILLPAAYLGILKSKNIIAKMSGYFILSYLFLWIVSYYPVYNAEYILLWMAVGTTMSSKARNISNNKILFKTKKR